MPNFFRSQTLAFDSQTTLISWDDVPKGLQPRCYCLRCYCLRHLRLCCCVQLECHLGQSKSWWPARKTCHRHQQSMATPSNHCQCRWTNHCASNQPVGQSDNQPAFPWSLSERYQFYGRPIRGHAMSDWLRRDLYPCLQGDTSATLYWKSPGLIFGIGQPAWDLLVPFSQRRPIPRRFQRCTPDSRSQLTLCQPVWRRARLDPVGLVPQANAWAYPRLSFSYTKSVRGG